MILLEESKATVAYHQEPEGHCGNHDGSGLVGRISLRSCQLMAGYFRHPRRYYSQNQVIFL